MLHLENYVKKIEADIFSYSACTIISKDHYVLLLDYVIGETDGIVKCDEKIDVEKILFDWYKKYDATIEQKLPQLSHVAIDQFLPLNLNAYIYLRVLKLQDNNENLEQIVMAFCENYETSVVGNRYLEGLVMPFIKYQKLVNDVSPDERKTLAWFANDANQDNVFEKILFLAAVKKAESKFIFANILIKYCDFYLSKGDWGKEITKFLTENVKLITFDFIENLLRTSRFDTRIFSFVASNMKYLHLTLQDINELFTKKPLSLEFNLCNIAITNGEFIDKYLPVLNLLKTKDLKLTHSFIKKGSVQLHEFDSMIETKSNVFSNGNTDVLMLFNRIPRNYMLKKLINITNSNDPSIFSQEMIISKFWDNFKQANTTSKTNRYLITCRELALNNLSETENFMNLIELVHMFPIHFKPSNILSADDDLLISVLVKEQNFNVIDTFNIVKRLHLVLERGENDNDEYLLLKCQSEYINNSDGENLDYLESTVNDFIDLLSEFSEYKCIFAHHADLNALWLRLIEYAKINANDEALFNKVLKLLPSVQQNSKYLDLLLT